MGFGATMGEVVEEGAGGALGVVGAKSFEDSAFESFDEERVGIFFVEPLKGGLKKRVKRFKIGIGFGEVFDSLGKVGGGEEAGIRLAEASMGFFQSGFFQMVEVVSARSVPRNLAFMKKIEVSLEWAPWLGGPAGQRAEDTVAAGKPDGKEAGFPLAAKIKQNPFILNRLAQEGRIAEVGPRVKWSR